MENLTKEATQKAAESILSVAKEKPVNNDFSSAMKELRRARSWSVEDVAKHSGLPLALVVSMERGTIDPALSMLQRLAAAFCVPVAALAEPQLSCHHCWEDIRIGTFRRCCGKQVIEAL